MTDYVTIANLAAGLIGEDDQLRSPDDDTHMGRTFKAAWNAVRQAATRDHTWNFAMARKGLVAEALDDVPYPWGYSYPLPAECLRLVEVLNCGAREYQLEGRSILTNSTGPVYIRFLRDIPETADWDATFVDAFAALMAFTTGNRIAGSAYDKDAGWKIYKAKLSEAKRVDARENPPVEFEPTSWELARFGGDGIYDGPPYPIPLGYPTA